MARRRPFGRILFLNDRKIPQKPIDVPSLMKSLTSKILRRLLGRTEGTGSGFLRFAFLSAVFTIKTCSKPSQLRT
jgi:hypothetical protein